MEYTCEVVASLVVESRGKSVTLDVTKLGAALFARAALHGLKQKIADAAAGAVQAAAPAKVEGESVDAWKARVAAWAKDDANKEAIAKAGQALMQKVCDSLEKGDWGVERAEGPAGVSAYDTRMGQLMVDHYKLTFPKGTKPGEKVKAGLAKFASLNPESQAKAKAYLDKVLEREAREAAELAAMAF